MTSERNPKLVIRVEPTTLINLRRYALQRSGSGKLCPIGQIIDELVATHLPDYLAADQANHVAQEDLLEEGPKLIHES